MKTQKNSNSSEIRMFPYTDKSFALFGEGTREIKSKLSALHGRFNRFLTHPVSKKQTPGWIFSNAHKADVVKLLKDVMPKASKPEAIAEEPVKRSRVNAKPEAKAKGKARPKK